MKILECLYTDSVIPPKYAKDRKCGQKTPRLFSSITNTEHDALRDGAYMEKDYKGNHNMGISVEAGKVPGDSPSIMSLQAEGKWKEENHHSSLQKIVVRKWIIQDSVRKQSTQVRVEDYPPRVQGHLSLSHHSTEILLALPSGEYESGFQETPFDDVD